MKEARKLAVIFVGTLFGAFLGVCGGYVLTYLFHLLIR